VNVKLPLLSVVVVRPPRLCHGGAGYWVTGVSVQDLAYEVSAGGLDNDVGVYPAVGADGLCVLKLCRIRCRPDLDKAVLHTEEGKGTVWARLFELEGARHGLSLRA
jgi:hypothetical protein